MFGKKNRELLTNIKMNQDAIVDRLTHLKITSESKNDAWPRERIEIMEYFNKRTDLVLCYKDTDTMLDIVHDLVGRLSSCKHNWLEEQESHLKTIAVLSQQLDAARLAIKCLRGEG